MNLNFGEKPFLLVEHFVKWTQEHTFTEHLATKVETGPGSPIQDPEERMIEQLQNEGFYDEGELSAQEFGSSPECSGQHSEDDGSSEDRNSDIDSQDEEDISGDETVMELLSDLQELRHSHPHLLENASDEGSSESLSSSEGHSILDSMSEEISSESDSDPNEEMLNELWNDYEEQGLGFDMSDNSEMDSNSTSSEDEENQIITPSFPKHGSSATIREIHTKFEWRGRSLPDSRQNYLPHWAGRGNQLTLPSRIGAVFPGDIVAEGSDQSLRLGTVLQVFYDKNALQIDFGSRQEILPIPLVVIFDHPSAAIGRSNPSEIQSQILFKESQLMQKLSLQCLSRWSDQLNLQYLIGNGSHKEATLFHLLCREYLKVPLMDKLDVVNSCSDGIVAPEITTPLRNVLDRLKSLLYESWTQELLNTPSETGKKRRKKKNRRTKKMAQIANTFLLTVQEEVTNANYVADIRQEKVKGNGCWMVRGRESSQLVLFLCCLERHQCA